MAMHELKTLIASLASGGDGKPVEIKMAAVSSSGGPT